jgi:hypothetical protein
MLDIETLRQLLRRWSYMDGWLFTLYQHDHEGIWIAITVELPDSRRPGERIVNCVRSPVPPIPTAEYFYQWLVWRLERIDSHEIREFARVDGRLIMDPHAPDANDNPS